jgi:hypothetical protein
MENSHRQNRMSSNTRNRSYVKKRNLELLHAVMRPSSHRREHIYEWMQMCEIPLRDRHDLFRHIMRNKRRLRDSALRDLEGMVDEVGGCTKRLDAAKLILYSDTDVSTMMSVAPPVMTFPSVIPARLCTRGLFRAILAHGDERIDDISDLFSALMIPTEEVDDLRQTIESNKEIIRLEIVNNLAVFKEFLENRRQLIENVKMRITENLMLLQ